MIEHLSYVMCDGCGDAFDCGDDAREARQLARQFGCLRIDGKDLCRKCQEVHRRD